MKTTLQIITTLSDLPIESLGFLVALAAIGLAAFVVYVMHSFVNGKGRK